jgi:hypothetical protein
MSRLIDDVRSRLKETEKDLVEGLCSSTFSQLEEFKFLQGKLFGVRIAQNIIKKVYKELFQEELEEPQEEENNGDKNDDTDNRGRLSPW